MSSTPAHPKTSNPFDTVALWLDRLQQKHPAFSFPFAVVKKYGDDQAGHQAALITYYGFLSLFPLLLVATSVIDLVAQHNEHLRDRLMANIAEHFPDVFANQIQSSIHTGSKTGLALIIGLLVTAYGTRGIANAVRNMLDHAWAIPKVKRSGFPKNALKSFALLLGGGLGVVFTTTLAGYATAALSGHSFLTRVVPIVINTVLLYFILMYVFIVGPSRKKTRADVRLGALVAAVGLLILQTVGGYLITHQLQNLRGLYGQFALVLAILFWLYLQAQVLTYAIEINVVQASKLWPRSLTGKPLTAADEKAYRMYVEKEAYRPKSEEAITVSFEHPTRH